MKCLRCGHCCCSSMVMVVKPEAATEDFKMSIDMEDDILFIDSTPCPNLSWDGTTAICTLHHYKWYKKTPCYSHGQIEQSPEDPCRMGEYLRKRKINFYDLYYVRIAFAELRDWLMP